MANPILQGDPPKASQQFGGELINWTFDRAVGAWSTRVGVEEYFKRVAPSIPWSALDGGVRTLFVAKYDVLQWVLLTDASALYVLVDWEGTPSLQKLSEWEGDAVFLQWADKVFVFGPSHTPKVVNLRTPVTSRDFSWLHRPPAPEPWVLETDPTVALTSRMYCIITETKDGGLGSDTVDDSNRYYWAVSYVTDTGSEGPMSARGGVSYWKTKVTDERYGGLIDIPKGPEYTQARRVYRTSRLGEVLRWVMDVPNNVDTRIQDLVPDSSLIESTASEIIPLPEARVSAAEVFEGSVVLGHKRVLYFSEPGSPETFKTHGILALDSSGGDIRGIRSGGGALFVLRENGVDLVTGNITTSENFSVVPVLRGEGGVSAHAMDEVPGKGMLILGEHAVYFAKTTNQTFGGLERLGEDGPVARALRRMAHGLADRARSAYSPKLQEWHAYFPADGGDTSLGIVYHVATDAWTTREGFPVGSLAVRPGGDLLFGVWENADASLFSWAGVYVISTRRTMGLKFAGDTWVSTDPPTSTWWSPWTEFGDSWALPEVLWRVYLLVRTTGEPEVALKLQIEGNELETKTLGVANMHIPEGTVQDVFDKAVLDTAKWDTSRVVPLRYDVGGVRAHSFRVGFETTDDIELVGWAAEVGATEHYTIRGDVR